MLRNLFKWFLISFVTVVAVLLIGGLLMNPNFRVTRQVEINAPADRLYALVSDPREWKRWSVWNQRDPNMQIRYSGPNSGSGAVWEWQSKSEGDGRMSFTTAEPGRRLGYDLFFPDFGTTSRGDFRFSPNASGGTTVIWEMNGDMGKNPMFRWMAPFADRMIGPDFEAGLNKLKEVAEKPPA
ncbi:SRPBCC family protein [Rivibacter subsaxonicus]|uniref:Uncharacterized protein YndB with AHSA1/START domain n=1 Tax=Rivibacter subsaxonicus TaxID=457575 RepID=A0A4V2FUQ5_9BURK|nr:SRPBCC family protein [Rivibacter subsaxonicus]RZU02916.1 uncharacterized protein YndB with AHSA1/START domain [Rivibacter subsaxonicus]